MGEEREEGGPDVPLRLLVSLLSLLPEGLKSNGLDERSKMGRGGQSCDPFEGEAFSCFEGEGVEEDGTKEGGELARDDGEVEEISLRESSLEDRE